MDNDHLLDSLLSRIAYVLYGEEGKYADETSFLSWMRPGIPFQPADLQFAVKGMNGADGEETRDLIRTAAEFSRQVNIIPSSTNGIFSQSDKNVASVYDDILRFSKVPKDEITKEEKENIERLRGLLTVKKTVKDIINRSEKEVVEDSPLVKAYQEMMSAYINELTFYNCKRIASMTGTSPFDVQDFALNGQIYELRVKSAMNKWVSNGYKEDYEKIVAYIRQVSRRSMALLKADLLDKFEGTSIKDPSSGASFYSSLFYPGNFVNTDDGWTQFGFTSKDIEKIEKESHSSTSGSAGLRWGLFSGSGDGGRKKDEKHLSLNQKDFSMQFKITQVTISRPWFSLDFVTNNLWNWGSSMHRELSDGGNPPRGQMIAFPTVAIFVKDIKVSSARMKDTYDEVQSTLKGGGSIGWGPFRFGATHDNSSKEVKTLFNEKTNTLEVEGMQLLAFKCYKMPKTPNCEIEDLE